MRETPNTINRRTVGATLVVILPTVMLTAIALFSTWGLRRRTGQMLPVAVAFLLFVAATQTIGTLHDISSVAIRQKIVQSWRGPYDLLIRPQAAVGQLER